MTLVLLWIGAALLEWRLWTWGYTPGPGEIPIMTVAWVPLFVAIPVAMFVVTWKWLGGRERGPKKNRNRRRRKGKGAA
jgi:hypothetical protein